MGGSRSLLPRGTNAAKAAKETLKAMAMGLDVHADFNPDIETPLCETDTRALLHESEALDQIARDLHIPSFTTFGDNRSVPAGFNGSPDELEELLGEWNEWFSIDDGLRVFDGIANAIRSDPNVSAQLGDPETVLVCLEHFSRALRIGKIHGALFRLELA
jgi:hypothetical protein